MDLPEPPPSLPLAAHELWNTACAELVPRGLTAAQIPLLEMLVMAAVRNREARAKLAQGSAVLTWGTADAPHFATNPWVKIEKDSAVTYLRLAETLGLSPAAQVRLGLMQVAGQSMLLTIAERVARAVAAGHDSDR
jgi:phage terminase small subunit